MMYCVNCEYPVTRTEVDNRKCNNCGNDPHHEKQQPKKRDFWLMFGLMFSSIYFAVCLLFIWIKAHNS